MEGFLRVNPAATTLPGSPTNSFLADEVASTCPLLTPSPPTNDLINPLPENDQPTLLIGDELATKLQHVKDDDKAADSASSSSSAVAEPACSQLLTHIHNNYHHITKDESNISQETNGKVQTLQLTFKKPPQDYFFMTWNWPLIRKISLYTFLSGLIAMLALVIAMISSLPKTCNPYTYWYQGGVFYEIFPASFSDSKQDGIGDFNGITLKADYLLSLNVNAVRLNSIFHSENYPENYKNATSLTKIAPALGSLNEFKILVDALHLRNISLILDLPIYPCVKKLHPPTSENDVVTPAIEYWIEHGVNGFYLKGLKHFVNDKHFVENLQYWNKILGPNRTLIVDGEILSSTPSHLVNVILNNVDLLDVHLKIENGVEEFSKQINSLLNGTLFSNASAPWIHWNVGNVETTRLANRFYSGNSTLGATLLQLMLPGTISIFYGDEIGLKQIFDPHEESRDVEDLHQLAAMDWRHPSLKFSRKGILPWMHGLPTAPHFDQLDLVASMIKKRAESPSIYMRSITKDGFTKANAEVKYSKYDLVVMQRWYPRRKNFVVVSNLGPNHISGDLSNILYSGHVVVGPNVNSTAEKLTFKTISLWPGESVVVILN